MKLIDGYKISEGDRGGYIRRVSVLSTNYNIPCFLELISFPSKCKIFPGNSDLLSMPARSEENGFTESADSGRSL